MEAPSIFAAPPAAASLAPPDVDPAAGVAEEGTRRDGDHGRAGDARGEREYRCHERAVIAMLGSRYRDLDHDSRYELYHEAWASVLSKRADGAQIDDLEGYLVGAAGKLASKRVYGADARRRMTFDPLDGPFAAVADGAQSPEEHVLAADEARRLRMLVEELDTDERALLALRIDEGLEPGEIRERLGMTERQYRRVAESAAHALLAQFSAFDNGSWARRQRSLLSACAAGIASKSQRERAQRLTDEDPFCRAMMSDLHHRPRQRRGALGRSIGTLASGSSIHSEGGSR